jgi:hypothetical protein
MQDVRTKEVPHRLHASPKGLPHHGIERQGISSKVCDLEPCALAHDAGVWFSQDHMITGHHIAEGRGKSDKKGILPSSSGRLGLLLPGRAIQAERIERKMSAKVL